MEVKIGVQYAPREIVLESSQSPDEVEQVVTDALSAGGSLKLVDDKGRRVLVAVDKITYVEIGEQVERRVGFGAL